MSHNLSNREVKKLFESWGFKPIGFMGGHLKMQHSGAGKVVHITAPGRHETTPNRAIKKAADVVGVSFNEFLAGPKEEIKSSWQPAEQFEKLIVEKIAVAEKAPDSDPDIVAWRSAKTKTGKVLAVLSAWPNRPLKLDTIGALTGLEREGLSVVCGNLARHNDDVVRAGYGAYMFIQEATPPEPTSDDLEDGSGDYEEPDTSDYFHLVHTDVHDRKFMIDSEGQMWVAIRVEPGFVPLK